MTPSEVAENLSSRSGDVREMLKNLWSFCGDISAETFDLMREATQDDIAFAMAIFQSSHGGNFAD